jgi:hypothetical protein
MMIFVIHCKCQLGEAILEMTPCFDQEQIYEVFLEPDADRYIVLVALAPSIASFALAYFTRPFPPEDQDHDVEDIEQRFRVTYVSYSNQHKNCTTV